MSQPNAPSKVPPKNTTLSQKLKSKFGSLRNKAAKQDSASKPQAVKMSDRDAWRRAQGIRSKFHRFRILIIGRANAGKTTILQKVCNTTDQPEIFSSSGERIHVSVLAPAAERGVHNIENEMIFRSNPGFIFHDSRGFEAGGVAELDAVRRFIFERSKMTETEDQLHVIWYCIPMDDSRPFTTAEVSFFSEFGTGSVPVIALFTKFDALDDQAYQHLEAEGASWEDAVAQAPLRAVADFEKLHLEHLYQREYPPQTHLYLRDMDKPNTDCRKLTEKTAKVLNNNRILQQLFVSTQTNNLALCIEYAVTKVLVPDIMNGGLSITSLCIMSKWFPHVVSDYREVFQCV